MIPDFDNNGNLPPGVHEATLEEIIARFSLPKSRKRTTRTERLGEFCRFARTFALRVYIDGSYTTRKLAPNDVDLVVFLRNDFDHESRTADRLKWFQQNHKKAHLHIFVFGMDDPEVEKQAWDMVAFFQKNTRADPPVQKGIILLRNENDD